MDEEWKADVYKALEKGGLGLEECKKIRIEASRTWATVNIMEFASWQLTKNFNKKPFDLDDEILSMWDSESIMDVNNKEALKEKVRKLRDGIDLSKSETRPIRRMNEISELIGGEYIVTKDNVGGRMMFNTTLQNITKLIFVSDHLRDYFVRSHAMRVLNIDDEIKECVLRMTPNKIHSLGQFCEDHILKVKEDNPQMVELANEIKAEVKKGWEVLSYCTRRDKYDPHRKESLNDLTFDVIEKIEWKLRMNRSAISERGGICKNVMKFLDFLDFYELHTKKSAEMAKNLKAVVVMKAFEGRAN